MCLKQLVIKIIKLSITSQQEPEKWNLIWLIIAPACIAVLHSDWLKCYTANQSDCFKLVTAQLMTWQRKSEDDLFLKKQLCETLITLQNTLIRGKNEDKIYFAENSIIL